MKKNLILKIIKWLIIISLTGSALILTINFYVKLSVKNAIINNYQELKDYDCILVLGAGVWGDKPSPMLEDRLNKAIELYKNGVASKIIMSGDHENKDYDEVNIMKNYAVNKGIDSKDIFMDHAGLSTYESIYRAKNIFKAKKIVIITQEYHLYRALYIAKSLGLEGKGVATIKTKYGGATYREIREILARNKDFLNCLLKPKPKYLGESIPVSGDGNITND